MKMKSMFLRRVLSLAVAVCLSAALALTAFGASSGTNANPDVSADRNGTIQIKVGVTDKENSKKIYYVQTGTGFLINDSTVVTCEHVVDFDEEAVELMKKELDMTEKQISDRKVIKVSVYRDQVIDATVKTSSREIDIAILELKQQLQNRTYLEIRGEKAQTTETCYALGFPGLIGFIDDANTYTSDDVTITSGLINKVARVRSVDYVVHSAQTLEGNSGGPLVDANGAVIGVTQSYTSDNAFSKDYMYAISIDQVIEMLDPLGIEYKLSSSVPEPGPEPDNKHGGGGLGIEIPEPVAVVDKSGLNEAIGAADSVDISAYTQETADAFNEALEEAKRIKEKADATESDVKTATEDLKTAQGALAVKPDNKLPLIIGGVVAAVVALILIIVLATRKGPSKPAPAPAPNPHPISPAPSPSPVNPMPSIARGPGTSVLGAGAGETGVLNAGSGETTVLSKNLGTLTRSKNGEKIKITKEAFTIGKEQRSVDYCVRDNTTVSRTHATIFSRGDAIFIRDNGSTNGTYVNGVRANPNQEVPISNGDKVMLSDEEFTFYSL